MRLDAVHVHGLGPFRDFSVDLEQFGDALVVAVVGANGAGKSTLLELALPGVLFRSCPTRGSLQDLATARDSYVEARVTNGATYTIRHSLDAVSKKGETVVLDASGAAVLPSTSVKAFDAWAARHLPSPEVFFSSMFAPQGAAGFLGAKSGDRKAILLRTLGIERYEVLSERAREHARTGKAALDTLRARIDDERRRGGDVEALEREIGALEDVARGADDAHASARSALELARSGAPAHETARREARAMREKRAEIGSRIAARRAEVAQIEQRVANNESVLTEAEKIRAAKIRHDELAVEIGRLGEELKAAEDRRLGAVRERDQHATAQRAAQTRAADARSRRDRARERAADRAAIERAVAEIASLAPEVLAAQDAEKAASAALETLRGERLAGADDRIEALRDGLTEIVTWSGSALGEQTALAAGALRDDDAACTLAIELPARLRTAEGVHRAARDRETSVSRSLADARALAARAGELRAAESEITWSAEAAFVADREAGAEETARAAANDAALAHESARVNAQEKRAVAQLEQTELAALVGKAGPLANAEGRLAELRPQLEGARRDLTELAALLEATPEPPAVPPPPDIANLEARLAASDSAMRGASEALTLARARRDRAAESAVAVAVLEEERARLEDEHSDWSRLGADLGRDGLQALEIDAAGPELTELVNDLLRSCVGPRWTVSIETTRPSADGKRLLEGCEVRVLDTERGREAEASTFSGGERVLLGEAVSLALTMLACRRSGLRGVTLVRDESGAALDPANARAYVAMLRRAAEIVEASRVLFVTHVPELVELADARIDVGASA